MEPLAELLRASGFAGLAWQNLVMFAVGGVLIHLAITRNAEPLLLVPIGFGAILSNLPRTFLGVSDHAAHTSDYNWWRLQKLADLYYAPGDFTTFFGVEWNGPEGHKNVMSPSRQSGPVLAARTNPRERTAGRQDMNLF